MKRLKKGPELNLSKLKSGNLKPPAALADLYRELKSQHLLPIVVLLVIGLVAIPILIGGSSDHKAPTVASRPKVDASSAEQTALKVSKWTPGLLDYKKTLRGGKPSNPFTPKVPIELKDSASGEAEAAAAPVEVPTTSEGGGSGEEAPAPEEFSPSPSEEANGGHSGEEAEKQSGPVTVDVEVTTVHEDGGVDQAPVKRDLPQLTKLPNEATPALTYVGPSDDGTKAMMAVSSEVTAMVGDSNCVVPAKPCSLLALKVGAPETIVYGEKGLTYRIELVRIGDHTNAPGKASRNHPAPGHDSAAGPSPSPRATDALIGVGGSHRLLPRASGF